MANYVVTKGYIGLEDMELGTSTFSRTTSTGGTQTMTQVPLGYIPVLAKTANYSVQSTDTGKLFTNTGAAGAVQFTLPACSVGLMYYFNVQATQTFTVAAGAGDKIRSAASLSAAAGNIASSTIGNSLILVAVAANEWDVIASTGTWTVT